MKAYYKPSPVLGVKDPSMISFDLCHPGAQSVAPEENMKYIISLCNNVAIRISRHQGSREEK